MSVTINIEEIAAQLNDISWDILSVLSKFEDLSFKDIRVKSGVSQEKISKEIARLEGALLIESKRDPADKRTLQFRITEYGLAALACR